MADGVDDGRSFWKWVEHGEAQKALGETLPNLELDVSNLLVGGESGGGYLTLQTALLGMTDLPIKVLFVQYPAAHLAKHFKIPWDPHPEAEALDEAAHPYSIVDEYMAKAKSGTICARAKFGSKMDVFHAVRFAGKFVDVSGDNAWLDPMSSLETSRKLPPILLYHSKGDEAVSDRDLVLIEADQGVRLTGEILRPGLRSSRSCSRTCLYISPTKLGITSLIVTIPWRLRGSKNRWNLYRSTGLPSDT